MSKGGSSIIGQTVMMFILLMVFLSGGFSAIWALLGFIIWAFVIGGIIYIVGIFMFSFDSNASKTVTYSNDFWGRKKRHIEYHDTGKVVDQVTSTNVFGRKQQNTYVTQPKPRRALQVCFKCHTRVNSMDGTFYCPSCHRSWGRRY